MKASLKLLVVVAFTTVANVALANVDKASKGKSSEVSAQIFSVKKDLVYVQLEKAGEGKIFIQIFDQDGRVLHHESIKEDVKVLKRFDVSNLPSGLYTYKVSNKDYTLRKKIEKK